jgi:hypothetical protein
VNDYRDKQPIIIRRRGLCRLFCGLFLQVRPVNEEECQYIFLFVNDSPENVIVNKRDWRDEHLEEMSDLRKKKFV